MTERIVKLETQNHCLKDDIKYIREGTLSRQDNMNMNMLPNARQPFSPSHHPHPGMQHTNSVARVDLNDEKILSPDLGNYVLEQASAQSKLSNHNHLLEYGMSAMNS